MTAQVCEICNQRPARFRKGPTLWCGIAHCNSMDASLDGEIAQIVQRMPPAEKLAFRTRLKTNPLAAKKQLQEYIKRKMLWCEEEVRRDPSD